MPRIKNVARLAQLILTAFLALTAAAGGVALMAGLNAPPLSSLEGSIFTDFSLPGLALILIVGGSALLAFILLLRGSRFAGPAAVAAGVIVMSFEFVEVLAIGSPLGPARFMQVFYFVLGILIIKLSQIIWYVDLSG